MNATQILENPRFPIFHQIYPICADAHKKQFRKDGKPYMSHIDAVIENTWDVFMEDHIPYEHWKETTNVLEFDLTLSLAASHDVIEDQPDKVTVDQLNAIVQAHKEQANSHLYLYDENYFKRSLLAISKNVDGIKTYDNYADYVQRVKKLKMARYVKIADLMHNLSDLTSGNLKEKYELTLHYLRNV